MICLTDEQRQRFAADGFVVVENVLDADDVEAAADRFEPLFGGEFEAGLMPDEWNWRQGRDADDLTRQICNGWKSDRIVRSIVTRADIGRACAELMEWPGARLNQDNVLWKPPGAAALGFHQDDSYERWIVPQEMSTCWIALDDTMSDSGTIEYVRGSHRWGLSPPISQFHAPPDNKADMRAAAAAAGVKPEIVHIECAAGTGVLHHGKTWHGSGANNSERHRRAVVAHCMSSEAHFHPTEISPIYGRYKRFDDASMDESFFPVLWTRNNYRTAFLDEQADDLRSDS